MDLLNLLTKLQAIQVSEAEDKAKKDYDKDGEVETPEEEHAGAVDKAIKKAKANEDIFNVLKGLQAIQEGEGKCDDCGEVHEGSCSKTKMKEETLDEAKCPKCGMDPCKCDHKKVDECGDMEMSPLTAPMAGIDMTPMAADYNDAADAYPGEENGPVEAEEKPRFTLSIQNGDSNLSMTTDVPDEIIHVMKLAGVKGKAEVKPAAPEQEQGEEKAVEEAWGNTPAATNEKEPRAYGDIRDWALKGTGKGQPGYGDRRAPGQGDNPLSETAVMAEYRKFKVGK